jgi:hypothetical protein
MHFVSKEHFPINVVSTEKIVYTWQQKYCLMKVTNAIDEMWLESSELILRSAASRAVKRGQHYRDLGNNCVYLPLYNNFVRGGRGRG